MQNEDENLYIELAHTKEISIEYNKRLSRSTTETLEVCVSTSTMFCYRFKLLIKLTVNRFMCYMQLVRIIRWQRLIYILAEAHNESISDILFIE